VKIIVDADSQPARDVILAAAKKNAVRTVFVMSTSHYSEKNEGADEVVLVDNRKQEADIKIMNLAVKGDIAITSDTGLGLFLKSKGVEVISGRGKILSENDLEERFNAAHIEKKAMRAKKGKAKISGPPKYTDDDRNRLAVNLEKAILKNKGESN
jgi:uncharacterized protein YaiI (UPF0178 family)